MSYFAVEGLRKTFGGIVAVDDLSFKLSQGEILGIIGPNGAGKTTVFNLISGLYRPDAGSIRFRGVELVGRKPHQIAQEGVARTFQNIELFAHLNTMENLMLGRHRHMRAGLFHGIGLWGRRSFVAREEVQHREAVERIIEHMKLEGVRNKVVGGLPYGIQKRVELARAMACEPSLLLLDEPAAGMNSEERRDLFFQIQDIARIFKVTILLIEHHMKMVMDLSDHVLAIDFGKTLAEGKPAEVAAHPQVIEAYLGGA